MNRVVGLKRPIRSHRLGAEELEMTKFISIENDQKLIKEWMSAKKRRLAKGKCLLVGPSQDEFLSTQKAFFPTTKSERVANYKAKNS